MDTQRNLHGRTEFAWIHNGIFIYAKNLHGLLMEGLTKSFIQETLYLLMCADSSTDTIIPRRGRPRWWQILHQLGSPLGQKKKKKKSDMWHVTFDTWHVKCDTWHVTHDRWGEVNLLSKCQVPCSHGLGVKVFWRIEGKGSVTESFAELITKVFVEQPRLDRVCKQIFI